MSSLLDIGAIVKTLIPIHNSSRLMRTIKQILRWDLKAICNLYCLPMPITIINRKPRPYANELRTSLWINYGNIFIMCEP